MMDTKFQVTIATALGSGAYYSRGACGDFDGTRGVLFDKLGGLFASVYCVHRPLYRFEISHNPYI